MEQDWRDEQDRVTEVISKISERRTQLESEIGIVKTDVVEIRKHFWDDVTINFNNPDDLAETVSSMKQQAEVLSERERRYRQSSTSMSKLNRLIQTPYFGRIDFTEEGEQNGDSIYLGISTFQDGDFGPFLIYDWRAPVSSLYYDHLPGSATYETPLGSINGQMELKRQFMIRDGEIQLMFDTGVTIGDEMLQQVLSRNSDVQMKSIVATIQREQNLIIRNDRCRMMIVQGSAGSGKTSAALQRVAYLLYKHRATLKADQIVLFSPNPLFNSYVSTVLPELGEENMQQTTFQEYLQHRLSGRFQVEDPFDQLEYRLTMGREQGYVERLEGIRFKSSPEFYKVILLYKDLLIDQGMIFRPIIFRGQIIIDKESLRSKFYDYDPSIRLLNRIELIRDWLLTEISELENKEIHKPWVEEEIELLSSQDYQRAFKELRRRQEGKGVTFDDFETEKEILARMIVRRHLNTLKDQVSKLQFVAVTSLYKQLFLDESLLSRLIKPELLPSHWQGICHQTLESLQRSELNYEDATPYLFLQELLQGFETNNEVRHVFIDEVQDYTPFQLEFLKRLFPRCKMTVLGDLNQAIYAHTSVIDDSGSLIELYGAEHTERIELTKSYRSTYEIVTFTQGMIPGGHFIESFQRHGDKPRLTIVKGNEELINQLDTTITLLRKEGYTSIGIICKTAVESVEAYEAIQALQSVRLITKLTPAYEKGVLVIPVYLAKGVEFDAVIIYNGSQLQYDFVNDVKLFYTACTRAMHLLHILSVGEPSKLITARATETYINY